MPRTEEGRYYSERIDLRDEEQLARRVRAAKTGGRLGIKLGALTAPVLGPAGGIVGGSLGAITGFILGDHETVFPVDMIAIPAYQAYLIQGTPAFQIFIKEGEVLTQVMMTDAQEALAIVDEVTDNSTRTRKPSKYNKAYSKAFDEIKGSYKLKNGSWAKNGFKRAVKAAHALTKKRMK